ncbi:unnamed protein product [Closterium sp. Yama58-4]|nr:unnamed protein product [Closterium sp. Yama58-4]
MPPTAGVAAHPPHAYRVWIPPPAAITPVTATHPQHFHPSRAYFEPHVDPLGEQIAEERALAEDRARAASKVGQWVDAHFSVPPAAPDGAISGHGTEGYPFPCEPEAAEEGGEMNGEDGSINGRRRSSLEDEALERKLAAVEMENCEMTGRVAGLEAMLRERERETADMRRQIFAYTQALEAGRGDSLTRAELINHVVQLTNQVQELAQERDALRNAPNGIALTYGLRAPSALTGGGAIGGGYGGGGGAANISRDVAPPVQRSQSLHASSQPVNSAAGSTVNGLALSGDTCSRSLSRQPESRPYILTSSSQPSVRPEPRVPNLYKAAFAAPHFSPQLAPQPASQPAPQPAPFGAVQVVGPQISRVGSMPLPLVQSASSISGRTANAGGSLVRAGSVGGSVGGVEGARSGGAGGGGLGGGRAGGMGGNGGGVGPMKAMPANPFERPNVSHYSQLEMLLKTGRVSRADILAGVHEKCTVLLEQIVPPSRSNPLVRLISKGISHATSTTISTPPTEELFQSDPSSCLIGSLLSAIVTLSWSPSSCFFDISIKPVANITVRRLLLIDFLNAVFWRGGKVCVGAAVEGLGGVRRIDKWIGVREESLPSCQELAGCKVLVMVNTKAGAQYKRKWVFGK